VRYVRNITDVGHLENDADEGEDKIAKKARLEELEPMEVVEHYTHHYHQNMDALNVKRPSIEPRASGHIIEQQQMVGKIMEAGYAYEKNGSIYFDVEAYNQKHEYGILSGRKLEDMLSNTRELDGQQEKKNPFDFALWKKATPEHIMRWPSEWSDGFPGWHMECSAMSTKYLGESFDIHGGGMDLLFPHHECEIAQSTAANGKESVRYWMHNNMITINGQKMGKSLGNFITLDELFAGNHQLLAQEYTPMTVRFFILQAHYRSTLDFSNQALQAAEKGLQRLLNAQEALLQIKPGTNTSVDLDTFEKKAYEALDDDLNSPILIAHLFDLSKSINNLATGKETITEIDLSRMKDLFNSFVVDILGLRNDKSSTSTDDEHLSSELIDVLLQVRLEAKNNKDFATSDKIRDKLKAIGVVVKDTPNGYEWKMA